MKPEAQIGFFEGMAVFIWELFKACIFMAVWGFYIGSILGLILLQNNPNWFRQAMTAVVFHFIIRDFLLPIRKTK